MVCAVGRLSRINHVALRAARRPAAVADEASNCCGVAVQEDPRHSMREEQRGGRVRQLDAATARALRQALEVGTTSSSEGRNVCHVARCAGTPRTRRRRSRTRRPPPSRSSRAVSDDARFDKINLEKELKKRLCANEDEHAPAARGGGGWRGREGGAGLSRARGRRSSSIEKTLGNFVATAEGFAQRHAHGAQKEIIEAFGTRALPRSRARGAPRREKRKADATLGLADQRDQKEPLAAAVAASDDAVDKQAERRRRMVAEEDEEEKARKLGQSSHDGGGGGVQPATASIETLREEEARETMSRRLRANSRRFKSLDELLDVARGGGGAAEAEEDRGGEAEAEAEREGATRRRNRRAAGIACGRAATAAAEKAAETAAAAAERRRPRQRRASRCSITFTLGDKLRGQGGAELRRARKHVWK